MKKPIGNLTRGPLLFPLIYAASLSLVALSAAALAVLGREHVTQAAIEVAVRADQAVALDLVRTSLSAPELESGVLSDAGRTQLAAAIARAKADNGYLDAELLAPDGSNLVGADSLAPGTIADAVGAGRHGRAIASIPSTPGSPAVLDEAIPVARPSGSVAFVLHVGRDAAPILARADAAWRDVLAVTAGAALVLVALLYAIFRGANTRLRRQQELLIESRRRDPLTGLLNHGAVVAALTELVEAAGATSATLGIAIVDVDNFRLLNDTHGAALGDQALLLVRAALETEAHAWTAIGRFGPDEFLVIAPEASARALPAALGRVAEQLEGEALEPPGSERLPITVSSGVSYFPFHAAQVTELMSAATIALGEAKAAGGNQVAIANAWDSERRVASTFDVLQGLVLAIDRKDRYTKLHSEDVASYALFLANLLDLPEEMRATLKVSALLHDIGKIGVPDDILRKPGRLTPREYEVLKQHVALGDLIVRDLPDIELVRAGVRYHHERWDGQGYLVGLAGIDIPLIARVLAVGDAFSAMTTTRPYRKALDVQAALSELRSSSGTQLDPDLVEAFVRGMETDPAAPLPGSASSVRRLWASENQAA